MSGALRYERVPETGELEAEARILSTAFGMPPDHSMRWIERSGRSLFRRVVAGDEPVATVVLIPMGVYFGGRSVPMTGIAGVAVDPSARGSGVGRWMMARALEEIRESGVPLSGLYSAMHPLYRGVGFEHAGCHHSVSVPMELLPRATRRFDPFAEADFEQVRACYAGWASRQDGHLDRGEYCWRRVWDHRGKPIRGYVSRGEDGVIDAYAFCDQRMMRDDFHHQVLHVTDFGATTRSGLAGVMGFLRGFSSIASSVTWNGGATHPALTALADRRYKISLQDHWMLRVVDPAGAMHARGAGGRGSPCSVEIMLEDPVFPDTQGPWILRRDAEGLGAGRGGGGGVRVSARALASLYAGFMSARELAMIGLVEGADAELDALDAVFPVGNPSMVDMF